MWIVEGYRTGYVEFRGTFEACQEWINEHRYAVLSMSGKTLYVG